MPFCFVSCYLASQADPKVSYTQTDPAEDSHMKRTGMLVLSLRGVNFECLVSPKSKIQDLKNTFYSNGKPTNTGPVLT